MKLIALKRTQAPILVNVHFFTNFEVQKNYSGTNLPNTRVKTKMKTLSQLVIDTTLTNFTKCLT